MGPFVKTTRNYNLAISVVGLFGRNCVHDIRAHTVLRLLPSSALFVTNPRSSANPAVRSANLLYTAFAR